MAKIKDPVLPILEDFKDKEKEYIKKFTKSDVNTAVIMEVSEDLGVKFGAHLVKKLGASFTQEDLEYFWSEFVQEVVYK